jgi:hypothetical protein
LSRQFHLLFSHGPGILTGLNVIASDPPDNSVYILPGVAVDPEGQVIVLPQPVSYDIGQELEGTLYLLLFHGESRPRRSDKDNEKDSPLYIHTEFSIAARSILPPDPWVELARVDRSNRTASFHNAASPLRPGLDEIDLRYRREINAAEDVKMAVTYLGNVPDKQQGLGAAYLAQAIGHSGTFRVSVEDEAALAPGIEANTLIYLVGAGTFNLEPGQMNFLNNYVRRGQGTLLIESLDPAAENIFLDILKTIELTPEPIKPAHPLLKTPHLFAVPPDGYETGGRPQVRVSEGVIFSTCNYGRLWQGEQRNGLPSREQIRSAMEWGANIVAYAARRRVG